MSSLLCGLILAFAYCWQMALVMLCALACANWKFANGGLGMRRNRRVSLIGDWQKGHGE